MITLGTHEELWGYNPDNISGTVEVKFGEWSPVFWNWTDENIYYYEYCEVKLCNELRGAMYYSGAFKDIVYEELTECLGCGNDTFHTYESMFSQVWYKGKTNDLIKNGRPTEDGEVVQMLYNELEIGEFASDVIHKLTPSTGAVIQLPCTKKGVRGHSYTITPFAINKEITYDDYYYYWTSSNNCYTDLGYDNAITINPITRPDDWHWSDSPFNTYTNASGSTNAKLSSTSYIPIDTTGFHPVTASEWNLFTQRVNDFREYCGCSQYGFTTAKGASNGYASSPNDVKPLYNEAVEAIQGIGTLSNGDPEYGAYLHEIADGRQLNADLFLDLEDELNAIP